MLFARHGGGEGVIVHSPAPKRQKPPLDTSELRILRAHTFQHYVDLGFTVQTIAMIFTYAESTVHADLAYLRDEKTRRAVAEENDPTT